MTNIAQPYRAVSAFAFVVVLTSGFDLRNDTFEHIKKYHVLVLIRVRKTNQTAP